MVSVRKHRTWLYMGEEGSIVEVVCMHFTDGSFLKTLLREKLKLKITLWLIVKAKTMLKSLSLNLLMRLNKLGGLP